MHCHNSCYSLLRQTLLDTTRSGCEEHLHPLTISISNSLNFHLSETLSDVSLWRKSQVLYVTHAASMHKKWWNWVSQGGICKQSMSQNQNCRIISVKLNSILITADLVRTQSSLLNLWKEATRLRWHLLLRFLIDLEALCSPVLLSESLKVHFREDEL